MKVTAIFVILTSLLIGLFVVKDEIIKEKEYETRIETLYETLPVTTASQEQQSFYDANNVALKMVEEFAKNESELLDKVAELVINAADGYVSVSFDRKARVLGSQVRLEDNTEGNINDIFSFEEQALLTDLFMKLDEYLPENVGLRISRLSDTMYYKGPFFELEAVASYEGEVCSYGLSYSPHNLSRGQKLIRPNWFSYINYMGSCVR